MYRTVLNFAKSYILSCLSKFYNKKNFTVLFLKYKRLKWLDRLKNVDIHQKQEVFKNIIFKALEHL